MSEVAGTVTYDGRTRTVVTWYACPPIPIRSMDYGACFQDYDLGDHIGWGWSPEIAVQDLLDWLDMDHEYRFNPKEPKHA